MQAIRFRSRHLIAALLVVALLTACGTTPQQALILDVMDLVDRYYVEKVDRREMIEAAVRGVVERLQTEFRIARQGEEIKELLLAREKGEEIPEPTEEETSPTPMPTPYDAVKVEADTSHVRIEAGGAVFDERLEYDKRHLANTLLDALSFLRDHLQLTQTPDELLQMAMDAMLYKLDPHSGFLNLADYKYLKQDTEGTFGGIGIEIGIQNGFLVVVAPIRGTPADKVGLQAKDRIVAIEGVDTLGQPLNWAVQKIRGRIGTPVVLTIRRAGVEAPFDVSIVRDTIEATATKSEMLPHGVGYIRIIQFNARAIMDLDKALADFRDGPTPPRVVILDLRNNPGGLLDQAVKVADRFIKSGMIVNTIGRGYLDEREHFATPQDTIEDLPLVLLVNGGSASASEIVAGALKDHNRALVLGYQTFGKGSVQSIFELRNETGLRLTTAMYYTPSNASIQAHGITPHVRFEVPEEEQSHLMTESTLEGHFANNRHGEPPAPLVSADAKAVYDYFVAKGWLKAMDREEFDDENDFILAFTERLLDTNDLTVPALAARAEKMIEQIPNAKPKD